MACNHVVGDTEAAFFVRLMEPHVNPSVHAQGGSVRVGRRDALDEKLGLRLLRAVEIEGEATIFLENVLDVREHLERNRELGLDVTIVGVSYTTAQASW